jgi:hypothetical protein
VKLVMTLLVRDEIDVIESQVDYHLAAGVDFVIAIDHNSVDGTSDVLRGYERQGVLRVLPPPSDDLHRRQGEWVTLMARLAAAEHAANWVINADADEFWFAHGGSLKDVFGAVHPAYGAVRGLMRHFVPRPDGPTPFYERIVARHPCMVERSHPYHFQVKVAHRGTPDVEVARGNHDAYGTGLRLLREWIPLEVLHFPLRGRTQMEQKYRRGSVFTAAHVDAVAGSFGTSGVDGVWAGFLVDDERLRHGLADGALAIDLRVRDALRRVAPGEARLDGFDAAAETPVEAERAFVSDVALFMESDAAVRLDGRIASLEGRLAKLAPVTAAIRGR